MLVDQRGDATMMRLTAEGLSEHRNRASCASESEDERNDSELRRGDAVEHGQNLSQVFAGQKVGVKQTTDHIWLVTFMDYDLGYFDDETCRLEPIDNPFGSKLLPMSPE